MVGFREFWCNVDWRLLNVSHSGIFSVNSVICANTESEFSLNYQTKKATEFFHANIAFLVSYSFSLQMAYDDSEDAEGLAAKPYFFCPNSTYKFSSFSTLNFRFYSIVYSIKG